LFDKLLEEGNNVWSWWREEGRKVECKFSDSVGRLGL
jgi:hypothetical protein